MSPSTGEGSAYPKQVADFLKATELTIYRLAAATKILALKVGGTWRLSKAELNQ